MRPSRTRDALIRVYDSAALAVRVCVFVFVVIFCAIVFLPFALIIKALGTPDNANPVSLLIHFLLKKTAKISWAD